MEKLALKSSLKLLYLYLVQQFYSDLDLYQQC